MFKDIVPSVNFIGWATMKVPEEDFVSLEYHVAVLLSKFLFLEYAKGFKSRENLDLSPAFWALRFSSLW